MVRERQAPRMPGKSGIIAPIVISDDEGEAGYEISASPMPNSSQTRRLDIAGSEMAEAHSQAKNDADLASESKLDNPSALETKEQKPSNAWDPISNRNAPATLASNGDTQANDEALDKFMEALKLGPDRPGATQKAPQPSHHYEPRTPGPRPPIFRQVDATNHARDGQPATQPKENLYSGFSGYTSAANPFNVPKKNKPRPEHHRPDPRVQDRPQFGQVSALQSPIVPRSAKPNDSKPYAYGAPQTPGPLSQRPGNEAVSIFRPTNKTITTPAAPRVLFSSKPTIKKPTSNIDMFTRLTNSRYEKPVTYKSDEFDSEEDENDPISSTDVYTYVDPEKATENLKALLEGALEDEEDKKPRRRSRQKADKGVDDLSERLGNVKVAEITEGKQEGRPDQGDNDDVELEEEEEEEDDGTVEGLNIKLLPHQVEGVAWMRDKEIGKKKTRGVHPKGGILADDMGLGKTVQSIALILTNPRPPVSANASKDDTKKKKKGLSPDVGKGTLIIAPLALIKQWEGEIESRVKSSHRLSTLVYHGPQKNKFSSELHKYDVVITTYGTLSAEHAAWEKRSIEAGLFSVTWFRLILDEAHTIKNRNAKTTQAACALAAEYRWCLTGTPMQNNLEELQSLIHFLRIKPYENLTTFKEQITKPLNNGRGGLAIRRLQVVLKAFMKRRTKDVLKEHGGLHADKAEQQDEGASAKSKASRGFKIVNREVIQIASDFTPEERRFYDRLQDRTDKTLERMMDSKLSYASALVLLLRLRQACNHPDLVKGDIEKDKDGLIGNVSGTSSQNSDTSVDDVADLMGSLTVKSKMCDVCQKELTSRESSNGSRCVECQRALGDLQLRPGKKLKKVKKSVKRPTAKDGKDEALPSRSRNRLVVLDSDDEDDENDGGKNTQTGDESSDEHTWVTDSEAEDKLPHDAIGETASTKVQNLMKILRDEAPRYKFIVFSFFTSMLDKIEPFMKAEDIVYARYDGGMRNDLREASLGKLRNDPDCRVLLCSLRAGSLGLNLTAASRVVILEPFWNPFVEEQAIDRVHRLNQTVDVRIYKLTIKDTVEERIVALQEKKRELANATIEGKQSAGKLTMNDMLALFGRDAESKYREDNLEETFKQRVNVLHKESRSASDEPDSNRRVSSGYENGKPVRRLGGLMESERRHNRPVKENLVFGRRWD